MLMESAQLVEAEQEGRGQVLVWGPSAALDVVSMGLDQPSLEETWESLPQQIAVLAISLSSLQQQSVRCMTCWALLVS